MSPSLEFQKGLGLLWVIEYGKSDSLLVGRPSSLLEPSHHAVRKHEQPITDAHEEEPCPWPPGIVNPANGYQPRRRVNLQVSLWGPVELSCWQLYTTEIRCPVEWNWWPATAWVKWNICLKPLSYKVAFDAAIDNLNVEFTPRREYPTYKYAFESK